MQYLALREPARISGYAVRSMACFAAGIIVLCLMAACGPSSKYSALPEGSKVLVVGDSLAAGYGLTSEQAWPALLASATGWSVENAGVSGDTTAQGLERLAARLDDGEAPAAVFVLLGGNDMLRKVPEEVTRANLGEIIRRIEAVGAQPILFAVPRPSLAGAVLQSLDDAEFYSDLVKGNRTVLIESIFSDVLSEPALKLDRLHPNAEGQREVARRLTTQLRDIGLVRK